MVDGSFEAVLERNIAESDAKRARIEELAAQLPNIGTRDGLRELAKIDPVIWTMFNRRLKSHAMAFDVSKHLTEAALKPFRDSMSARDFEKHVIATQQRHRPWQLEPLRDEHPQKVYKKARQIGISELSLTEATCFLDQHPNTNLIYCFPRDKQLETFATTRINPMFEETPRMRALLTGVNQVQTKRVNQSHMILRSAWESGLGEGVNADVVVLDEKDRMKPGVDVAFRESMSSSPYQWLREVSTPSLPNRGVDASWMISDQREWFVKCSRCGMKQPITVDSIRQMISLPIILPTELPENAFAYICTKAGCGGTLDRTHGEWVARHPSVKLWRGYHMPQMIAIWVSATDVMRKRVQYKFNQLWMNYVLGEVALGESMLLTDHDYAMANAGHRLVNCRADAWPIVSVGIDWGHRNWVVVKGHNTNGRDYVINARMFEDDRREELRSVRQIDEWIEQFNPDIIIADDGYGKDRNAYLLRRYGEGRFFACRYNSAEKGGATFTPRWGASQVLCDRTMSLKNLCRAIKDREIGLPSVENEIVRVLISHLKALVPLMEEDEDTKEIHEIIQAVGDDHLAHSLFYAALGMDHVRNTSRFDFEF